MKLLEDLHVFSMNYLLACNEVEGFDIWYGERPWYFVFQHAADRQAFKEYVVTALKVPSGNDRWGYHNGTSTFTVDQVKKDIKQSGGCQWS